MRSDRRLPDTSQEKMGEPRTKLKGSVKQTFKLLAQLEGAPEFHRIVRFVGEILYNVAGKYSPVRFSNFVYFCATRENGLPLCRNVVIIT